MVRRFLSCVSVLALAVIILSQASAEETAAPSLDKHPLYSTYVFRAEANTIDFAIQPLAAPLGVIAEVMKRDRTLKKQLKSRSMNVAFHPFLKGQDINFFVRRGDIDAAMTGDSPALAIASTHDVVIAALVKQGYTVLISRKRSQMRELRGKRIGYVAGSTAHYNLLIALQTAGIREPDVILVPMEVNELADAIEKGRVDAIAAFQPLPSAILEKHADYAVLQKFLSSNYLFFTKAFVSRRPEEAALLMASYLRALRWMKKDRANLMTAARWNADARARFQKKPSEATPEQIAEITKKEILQIAAAPFIPLKDLTEEGTIYKAVEFLKSKDLIPSSTPWSRIQASLDRAIMADVLSKPRKYRLDAFDYDRGEE